MSVPLPDVVDDAPEVVDPPVNRTPVTNGRELAAAAGRGIPARWRTFTGRDDRDDTTADDGGDGERDGDGEDWSDEPLATGDLRIDDSTIHGTGVFATRAHQPGAIIERCPVLVLDAEDASTVADTMLRDYVYEWGDGAAVALGFGSLYNHSRTPNARYEMAYDHDEIHVVAIDAITPGTEITINYNGDPTSTDPVWFELDE